MLTLILADTELERVPQELTGHQQVVTAAARFGVKTGRMLLDSSLHYAALRKIQDGDRRGRPDILHFFLLTALESPLNKAGKLRVLVHTRGDKLLRIDPTTRLIRNYNRFCGLMEQLLETGRVPPDKPLPTPESGWTLADVIASVKPDRLVVLDETGTVFRPWDVFTPADATASVACVIGGFPSGPFRSELPPGERVAFGDQSLSVWSVAAELVVNYERVAGLEWPPGRAATPSGVAGPRPARPPPAPPGP